MASAVDMAKSCFSIKFTSSFPSQSRIPSSRLCGLLTPRASDDQRRASKSKLEVESGNLQDAAFLNAVVKTISRSYYRSNQSYEEEDDDREAMVQSLTVPADWATPSKALEESEWLRVTLHKWLDDEYCPEETNVEISKVAANSYYKSLVEKNTDLGDILLKMARELESISYKESFHGAFSSANAAVNLIAQRIELL